MPAKRAKKIICSNRIAELLEYSFLELDVSIRLHQVIDEVLQLIPFGMLEAEFPGIGRFEAIQRKMKGESG